MSNLTEAHPIPSPELPLAERIAALRASQPKLRARDVAATLGVSEAELVAAGCGDTAIRLRPDFRALLPQLGTLGKVMALTRNDDAVHEKRGPYLDIQIESAHALVLGEQIDLRIFPVHWKHGFAVTEETHHGIRRSLQFFDGAGVAVHKLYLEPESDLDAYLRLIDAFRSEDQGPAVTVKAAKEPTTAPRADVDAEALRSAWRALEDTHDFFPMLRKFRVERVHAMELAGTELAVPLGTEVVRPLFEEVAANGIPIMVFVGNRGCIQIHSGPIRTVKQVGPWLNVLDPDFNLHLRSPSVATAWLVRKPTRDGVVTSIELFDARGENIALIFGVRKPGFPESQAWRDYAEALVKRFPLEAA